MQVLIFYIGIIFGTIFGMILMYAINKENK